MITGQIADRAGVWRSFPRWSVPRTEGKWTKRNALLSWTRSTQGTQG
jgi:hypothetical protein